MNEYLMPEPEHNHPWNLLIERIGERSYRVIMPDRNGELPQTHNLPDGFVVSWPTNPHFSGISVIRGLLSLAEPFRGCTIE